MTKKVDKITVFYTMYEGGDWHYFNTKYSVTDICNALKKAKRPFNTRINTVKILDILQFHSILTPDSYRWDCVNRRREHEWHQGTSQPMYSYLINQPMEPY